LFSPNDRTRPWPRQKLANIAKAKGKRLGRRRVAADARRIAVVRKGGASWATTSQETGLSKGTAQRARHGLPTKIPTQKRWSPTPECLPQTEILTV
jgi:hypothetical protein